MKTSEQSIILRNFIEFNVRLSKKIESWFPFRNPESKLAYEFLNTINDATSVADIGGGKKPAKRLLSGRELRSRTYDGYDVDLAELRQAKDCYTNIYYLDLTSTNAKPAITYDRIICMNTLEHVRNASKAIENLAAMLKEGGIIYLKMPCKHAAFAKLNLLLPNAIKKRLLHLIYPDKIGDGFPVFYDKATPNVMCSLCESNGLRITKVALTKWSSYFSFLAPIYLAWRIYTVLQNIVTADYCESFELIAVKQTPHDDR